MIRVLLEMLAFFSAVLVVVFALIVFALAVSPASSGVVREIVQSFNTGDWE